VDKDYQIKQPTSQYFASQLINLEWVQPGNAKHQLFPAVSDVADPVGHVLVTAYALERPDGQWALMIVNKDQGNPHEIKLIFQDTTNGVESFFSGPVDIITFGAEQYRWNPAPDGGSANPDGPAVKSQVAATETTAYMLPKASVSVLRGRLKRAR